jgi:hypothetical protein
VSCRGLANQPGRDNARVEALYIGFAVDRTALTMYKRTKFKDFLLALALLAFCAFWARAYFGVPLQKSTQDFRNLPLNASEIDKKRPKIFWGFGLFR